MSEDAEDLPLLEAANARADFQLTYSRSASARSFHEDGINGAMIDDAFHRDNTADGTWSAGGTWRDDLDVSEQVWIERFFTAAIQEAVHEVCEWFHLDGRVMLTPHGVDDETILDLSAELGHRLFTLVPPERLVAPDET